MRNQLELRVIFVFLLSAFVTHGYTSSKFNQSLYDDKKAQPKDSKIIDAFFRFDIFGDTYPHASFYAVMNVGDPPQVYYLDIDSGSVFTWIYTEASENQEPFNEPYQIHNNFLPKSDPYCLASTSNFRPMDEIQEEACTLSITYTDGGHVDSVAVRDYFRFVDSVDTPFTVTVSLVFGAGKYENKESPGKLQFDGVLGVGKNSKLSIGSQLKEYDLTANVYGHCLSRDANYFGYGFFGQPPPSLTKNSAWIKMIPTDSHYAVGPAILLFNEKFVASEIKLILDSGSTSTYFNHDLYNAIYNYVLESLSGAPLIISPDDKFLEVCWAWGSDPNKPINTIDEVNQYFKPMIFGFAAEELIVLQPHDYLLISPSKHVCFGILDGGNAGLGDINLIGDVSMLDKLVVYDNERGYIGWGYNPCIDRSI